MCEDGADVNRAMTDIDWVPPLHVASENGHVDCVGLLLDNGADIKKPDNLGNSPLHYAANCEHGQIDVVRLLPRKGADLNQTNRKGEAPHAAARDNAHVAIAKLLLDNGADATLT